MFCSILSLTVNKIVQKFNNIEFLSLILKLTLVLGLKIKI